MASSSSSTQQLLDALTSHLSLFHSSNPNPTPPNPNPRAAILRWFASLDLPSRRAALTVAGDPHHFASLLLSMLRRLRRHGHGLFFLLPDVPSASDPTLPSLLFRRSRGLLARAAASAAAEHHLPRHLLLFSTDGPRSHRLDAVTVSEALVADVDAFVAAMDAVSGGRFLVGELDEAAGWPEMAWLKEKGYYSIEEFAANRLEIALRSSWLASGGKKGRMGKAAKEKAAAAGVAANAFWRQKGCLDWWARLDQRDRRKVVATALGKGAVAMANEIVEGSDNDSMDEFCFCSEAGSSPTGAFSWQSIKQSFFRRNRPGYLDNVGTSSSQDEPTLAKHMKRLLVVQEIASLMCQVNHYDADALFFTTLASAGTISDYTLMKLRGLLMVVSTDCTNLELMGNGTLKSLSNKDEEKTSVGCRRGKKKCSNSKKTTSTSKLSKGHGHGRSESNSSRVCPKQHTFSAVDSTINTGPEEISEKAPASVLSKEHVVGLGDRKANHNKKKNKRKGKTKASTLLRDNYPISEKTKNSVPFIAAESSVEHKESVDLTPLDPLSDDRSARNEISQVTTLSNYSTRAARIDGSNRLNSTGLDENFHPPGGSSSSTVMENCEDPHKSDGSGLGNCVLSYTNQNETMPQASLCLSLTDGNISSSNLYGQSVGSLIGCGKSKTQCDFKNAALPRFVSDVSAINKEHEHQNSGTTTGAVFSPVVPTSMLQDAVNGNGTVVNNNSGEYYVYNNKNQLEGTSYEWPSITPPHFVSPHSQQHPAATDRLHLDVGYKWPTQFDQSFLPANHQVRNSPMEGGCNQMLHSLALPLSFDWPPAFRGYNRSCQNMAPSYDSVYTPTIQPSAWSGFPAQVMQRGGTYNEKDRKHFGDNDLRNTSDFGDDTESYWFSEEESDSHAFSGRDYNQYFGGGVMYWSPVEHGGTGFSRAPSHSSDDSAWAWHEADVSRVIDDMVGMPVLASSYSTNGVTSPPTTPFCSPNESLDPPAQSVGYSMAGNDINGNVLSSASLVPDSPEDRATLSANNSSCSIEAIKGDTLPYSMLRPIIVPGISRRGSRSEFKGGHDHRSPCVPSTRRDMPRVRRPPSPVVLCVPRVPRPPPPSPVGESRKRGFPIVRSGSSSPRHWGMRSLFSDEKISDKAQLCLDGPEVVWPSWGNKGISNGTLVQSLQESVLQDHLIKISQLSRDQQHPDVALPLQPPDMLNCSSRKTSLSLMHNLLHEEIDHFCKQVAAGNLMKKPYVNWAVQRVTRCLQVLWPRSRTNIFGSNATGLALPTSDVDLVVSLPPVRNLEPIKEAGILEGRNGIKETCLQHAARYLVNQEWVRSDSLKTIENTAIPIIMLVAEVPCDTTLSNENSSTLDSLLEQSANMLGEQGSPHSDNSSPEGSTLFLHSKMNRDDAAIVQSIRLDISFKSPSHTGLQTSELVRELTQQFPACVPLALVLKRFLAERSLDHSYSGGLSSYCLVLLITRFLQHEHHVGQPISQNLGSLLMDFLYFFGNVFDPRQMRISIQGSGIYMNRERGHSIDPIHIDDPLFPANNVGRNCFRIHQCIKAFADAFSVLEDELVRFSGDCTTPASSFSLLQKIIPNINCDE